MNQPPDDHDPVSESFASFRNGASNMFPAPEVNDVMAAAPARRRRRAIGVTVAVTAATGLTAAGMAVAQNINGDPPPVADHTTELPSATPSPETTEEGEWTEDDTFEPQPTEDASALDVAPAFHFWDMPGAADECPGGEYEFLNQDEAPTEWELDQPDAPWELDGASLTGDVNDDGADDLVLALNCDGHPAVAAFDQVDTETGLQLHQFGWVWLPEEGPDPAVTFELAGVDDGVITLRFGNDSEESYAFDGESFTLVDDDDPDDEETPTEEPSEEPDDSPTGNDDPVE